MIAGRKREGQRENRGIWTAGGRRDMDRGTRPLIASRADSFQGSVSMTHTVCQPCYDCKYTDCVAVCPVECFWQDEKMLYIDPVDCIDCEACVPECPVEAIFAQANVPAQWTDYTP